MRLNFLSVIRESSYSDQMPFDVGASYDTNPSEAYTGAGLRLGSKNSVQLFGSDTGLGLTTRFMQGAFHGAVDMAYQPLAQVVDLGQALYGLTTGGAYEPRWFSGIGQNYAGGMGYGETVFRSLTGIPVAGQVLGVGLSSYDLTGSALRGDWGGLAEGLGGLAGGFAVVKYGQRRFAPEPGAELGIYRTRPQVDMTDPARLAATLPGREVPNFTSAEPISLGGRTLNRVFDTTDPSRAAGGAKPNGGYWTEQVYSNETSWRTGVAVPENAGWNKGTLQGEWQPADGYGWGGRAAPQALLNYSYTNKNWGFSAGWIQRGGDHQIFVPNSYNSAVIPTGGIKITPTPWSKP